MNVQPEMELSGLVTSVLAHTDVPVQLEELLQDS